MRSPKFSLKFYRHGCRGCTLFTVFGPRIEREIGAWPCPRDLGVILQLRNGRHRGQLKWEGKLILGQGPAFLLSS